MRMLDSELELMHYMLKHMKVFNECFQELCSTRNFSNACKYNDVKPRDKFMFAIRLMFEQRDSLETIKSNDVLKKLFKELEKEQNESICL